MSYIDKVKQQKEWIKTKKLEDVSFCGDDGFTMEAIDGMKLSEIKLSNLRVFAGVNKITLPKVCTKKDEIADIIVFRIKRKSRKQQQQQQQQQQLQQQRDDHHPQPSQQQQQKKKFDDQITSMQSKIDSLEQKDRERIYNIGQLKGSVLREEKKNEELFLKNEKLEKENDELRAKIAEMEAKQTNLEEENELLLNNQSYKRKRPTLQNGTISHKTGQLYHHQ